LFVTLWNVKVLPSSQHFVWKVILNRVVTKENIIVIWEMIYVLCVGKTWWNN